MSEMIVQVRNKMLRRIGGVNHFVSHNKDYTIQFQFDESWDNVRTKMAVFAYEDGEYGSEIFEGDVCKVPELPREGRILIGVKAGEDLSTELLCIPVCKSADDVITDEYDEPDPKIYEQILDIINNLWNGGTTVYPSPVRFLAAPNKAETGQFVRVKKVDENGEVEETEAVDVEKELVVVNITEDTDGVLHADMTYDEINPLRYTHAVYAKWASGMYPYSTSARMYFGEELKNVFVFSSSMTGAANWRIAIAQDGSVRISSYELELVGRKVQTIDETTGAGDDAEKNYPSAKAVYDALANVKDKDAVKFVEQDLTEEQKQQARDNIGIKIASKYVAGLVRAYNTSEAHDMLIYNSLYVFSDGTSAVPREIPIINAEKDLDYSLWQGTLAGGVVNFAYTPFINAGLLYPCYLQRFAQTYPNESRHYLTATYLITDLNGVQLVGRSERDWMQSGSTSWNFSSFINHVSLPTPTTAKPDQIISVKSVDETGKITETEASDFPTASPTTLGGVKPIAKTDSMTQEVGIDAEGKLYTRPSSSSGGSITFEQDGDYISITSTGVTITEEYGYITIS